MIESFNAPPDTSYLSEFDLQTLAEDSLYEKEIRELRPKIFFRPDDRTSPLFPTYFKADSKGI